MKVEGESQLSDPVDLLQAISRFLTEAIEKESREKDRLKMLSNRESYSDRCEERAQNKAALEKLEALGVREKFQISELRRTIAYTATKISHKLGGGLKVKETANEVRFLLLLNMNQLEVLEGILGQSGPKHRSDDRLDPRDGVGRDADSSFMRHKNQGSLAIKLLQEIDLPAPSYELHPHFAEKPQKQMVTGKRCVTSRTVHLQPDHAPEPANPAQLRLLLHQVLSGMK
jgi:hypothetical protein